MNKELLQKLKMLTNSTVITLPKVEKDTAMTATVNVAVRHANPNPRENNAQRKQLLCNQLRNLKGIFYKAPSIME